MRLKLISDNPQPHANAYICTYHMVSTYANAYTSAQANVGYGSTYAIAYTCINYHMLMHTQVHDIVYYVLASISDSKKTLCITH
jgi:hypothetical protein